LDVDKVLKYKDVVQSLVYMCHWEGVINGISFGGGGGGPISLVLFNHMGTKGILMGAIYLFIWILRSSQVERSNFTKYSALYR